MSLSTTSSGKLRRVTALDLFSPSVISRKNVNFVDTPLEGVKITYKKHEEEATDAIFLHEL